MRFSSRSSLLLAPLPLLFIGCVLDPEQAADGSVSSDAQVMSDVPPVPVDVEVRPADLPPGEGFDAHEWGMVRFSGQGADLSTSGHGFYPRPYHDTMAEKPLIYLHPHAGFDPSTEIEARITVLGGRVREVWPAGGAFGEGQASYAWPTIKIRAHSPCGVEEVPQLRGPDGEPSEFCASFLDGVCETAEMHAYLEEVPHCLSVGGLDAPVLLYNAHVNPEQAAPVVFEEGALAIRNTSAWPVGPLWLATEPEWVSREIYRIDALGPGERASIQDLPVLYTEENHDAFLFDLQAALMTLGLVEREARDFLGAWRPNVLLQPGESACDERQCWQADWSVLGFYAPGAIDALYPLQINPSPERVTRVMAFTVKRD